MELMKTPVTPTRSIRSHELPLPGKETRAPVWGWLPGWSTRDSYLVQLPSSFHKSSQSSVRFKSPSSSSSFNSGNGSIPTGAIGDATVGSGHTLIDSGSAIGWMLLSSASNPSASLSPLVLSSVSYPQLSTNETYQFFNLKNLTCWVKNYLK